MLHHTEQTDAHSRRRNTRHKQQNRPLFEHNQQPRQDEVRRHLKKEFHRHGRMKIVTGPEVVKDNKENPCRR